MDNSARVKITLIILISLSFFGIALMLVVFYYQKINLKKNEVVPEIRSLTPKEAASLKVKNIKQQISDLEQKDISEKGGLTDQTRQEIIGLYDEITKTDFQAMTLEEVKQKQKKDAERQSMVDEMNRKLREGY